MDEKGRNKVSIKWNYIYNMSYQLLSILVPILTTPYISRVLGADGVGIYSYTLSIVTYFTILGNLGIATYAQLQISYKRDDKKQINKLFWEITIMKNAVIGISMLVYFIFICVQSQYQVIYTLLVTNMIASALDITWFLQGLEQFKKTVVRNYLVRIINVILIFTLIKSKNDLYKYIIIMQGTTLLGNVSLWVYLKEYISYISLKELNIKQHWKASLIYFVPTIATSVYTILDKTMIGLITGSSYENGYFEQAYKIEQVSLTVITSLNTVILPRMAFLHKQNQIDELLLKVKQSIRFILCLSIPMAFGLSGIASNLVPWFLGEGYEKCIILIRIFSVLLLIVGLNHTIGTQLLVSRGEQKKYNMGVIIGACVNFVMNVVLINLFASIGAAIASVCAELLILIVFLVYTRSYISINFIIQSSFKYCISGLLVFITEYLGCTFLTVTTFHLIILITVGIGIYFIGVFLLRDKFIIDILRSLQNKIRNK